MRIVECEHCLMNVIEVDDTPDEDGATSSVHCMYCGHDTKL